MSTTPSSRKPTCAANLLLLFFLLLVLGAFAGGGWWAYNKFVRKKSAQPALVADTRPKKPAPTPAATTPTPSTKPPGVVEQPSLTTPPGTQPSVPPTTTPSTTDPPLVATVPDPTPGTTPGTPPQTGPDVVATTPPTTTTPTTPPTTSSTPPDSTPPTIADNPTDALPIDVVADVPPQAEEPITVFPEDSPEVKALKEDADRRIGEAPSDLYPDREKTRVRMALRNSRKLARVATLHFPSGSAKLGAGEQTRLKKALVSPEAADLMSDPGAALVCIGFADQTGDPQRNKEISKQRAMNVIGVLKKQGVKSTTYPVAIGGTELIAAGNKNKNRAVEVWLVLQ